MSTGSRPRTTVLHHLIHNQSLSIQEYSPETIDQWIREIRDVSPNELKIKISQKATNGDQFVPILRKIHNILQQLTIRQWKHIPSNTPTDDDNTSIQQISDIVMDRETNLQMALRHLGSETIPGLIIHMSNISLHVEEMGKLLLDVVSHLMALDPSCPLSFPSMFATCLIYINSSFWTSAVDVIINQLCYYALPLAILYPHELKGKLDSLSVSGTLMLIMDNHSCERKHHMLITSVLMKIKLNACTDLLSVIAYGTPEARTSALKLLLHYWPLEFPDHSHKDPFANLEIPCPDCTMCNNPANYLCLEGSCTKQYSKMLSKDGNKRLFSLLCAQCDGAVHRTISRGHKRFKIVQPLREVKPNCELRRVCGGGGTIKRATVTCYGESCTTIQNGYPIRLCHECHLAQHNELNDPFHIYQIGPQNPWTCQDMTASSALLEAVAKLLATPPKRDFRKESQRRPSTFVIGPSSNYAISISNSCEGIVMLYQYCKPVERVKQGRHQEWLEYLIALLLEWLRLFSELIEKMMRENNCIEEFRSFLQFLSIGRKTSDQVFSNHSELQKLLLDYAIPWLKSVCESENTLCIVPGLLPHPQGHVQVGTMWQHSVDEMTRHRRTLSIIGLLVKNTILPQESLDLIYNSVMPHWMDLLIELRTNTGEMDKLKDLFHAIFPPKLIHDIRIKRFEFIRETFFKKSSKEKQRALFWLQDLSRLKVIVPYTSHIFEGSLQIKKTGRRPGSIDVLEGGEIASLNRRESTGSLSGNESETSGLVSQTSVEGSEAIIQLNYALPRYILMLDIWFSQLQLDGSSLSYEVFQKLLVFMLRTEWGSTHSLQDHHDTSNTCILCQATSLWFSLSGRVILHYISEEEEPDDGTDGGTPPMTKRGRVSKFGIPTLKKKLTQTDLTTPVTPVTNAATATGSDDFKDSWENISFEDSRKKMSVLSKSSGETVIEEDTSLRHTAYTPSVSRDRRPPIMTRYSDDLEPLSSLAMPSVNSTPSVRQAPVDVISNVYSIFQLSVDKLSTSLPSKKLNISYKYHPDTMLQIVQMLHVLVTKGRVLTGSESSEIILKDSHKLLYSLWRIMECDASYVHQACVSLFLATQDAIIPLESPNLSSIQSTYLWSLLYGGFSGQGWEKPFKTVDKLSMMLQFIAKTEGGPIVILRPHLQTELVLGQGFCKMVRLIQDKDSRVSTRVRYCLDNMKHESFEAIKTFLLTLFSRLPSYRGLVLQTLSLLSTNVSSYSFLSISFFLQLLREEDLLKPQGETDDVFHHQATLAVSTLNQKKISDASVLSSGRGFKEARPSTTSSAFSVANFEEEEGNYNTDILQLQCDTLTLLLEFISNQNSNFDEAVHPSSNKTRRITRVVNVFNELLANKEQTSESLVSMFERFVGKKFLIAPQVLCRSRIYETFIVKTYKILDKNIEFSKTKSFLTFVVRLLGYSVTPTRKDYPFINSFTNPAPSSNKSSSIGYLPSHLQGPWLRVLFILLYKYSHMLVKLESTEPLLYCIETIVNSLSSSIHVCPTSSSSSSDTNDKKPETSHASDPTPQSPIIEITESPLKSRSSAYERKPLDPVPEESGSFSISWSATSSPHKPLVPNHSLSITSVSSTFTSSVSTDHLAPVLLEAREGVCSVCNRPNDVYVEEVVSLCVLCLGTCSHRIPNLVSPFLVSWLIPCIAKVAIPGHYYWQVEGPDLPPPGSGLSIARKFLLTLLTQFAERKVFVYLFRHNYKDEVVFNAVYTCLTQTSSVQVPRGGEEEEETDIVHLNISSPVKYFLEDVTNSVHFTQEVTVESLKNLACFLEFIPETFGNLFWNLSHLELFLKKLKEQPTINVLYESFDSLLRIIIQLLKYCDSNCMTVNPVSSLTLMAILQELPEIISECFQHVYVPAGGLVSLVGVWYKAFLHFPSTKRREVAKKFLLLKQLIEEFGEGLSHHSSLLPENLISLCQCFFILLNEYAYFGYIDTLSSTRVYAPQLGEQEIHMGNLVNSCEGIEVAFHNALRFAINYLACELSNTSLEVSCQVKLTIAQLVVLRVNRSIYPLDIIRRILEGQYSFSWVEKGSKSRNSSKHHDLQIGSDLQAKDHINSLMLLGWLLLGSLCHNSVHGAVIRAGLDRMGRILSTECEILLRLASPINKAVANILRLVICALKCLVNRIDMAYWGLNCILCFCSIWTVYMELHVEEAIPEIVNFWRTVVDVILELPTLPGMLMCKPDIVETFCIQIMIPLKKASSGVSSFSLLLPTWKRVISMLPNPEEAELPDYANINEVCMDVWFRDMLKKFTELESKYLS